jgi:hypothetical protein
MRKEIDNKTGYCSRDTSVEGNKCIVLLEAVNLFTNKE